MGMQNSDDEEEIFAHHEAEQAYRRLYPWRSPRRDASVDELAFYAEEVRQWANRKPGQ